MNPVMASIIPCTFSIFSSGV